jgi:hypothetical protein
MPLALLKRWEHDVHGDGVVRRHLRSETFGWHGQIDLQYQRQLNAMTPNSAMDKFRLREIEQRLAAELHAANEQMRLASTDEEKRNASDAHQRSLQRFADFAARGIVPEEFLPPSSGSH